jgi:hypothetical protein
MRRPVLLVLVAENRFDSVVIAISTSVPARTRFRELCGELGIPLANAIDPSARIAAEVELGAGNVVCAFCHFGVGTRIGDNNFLSAYNSFDHRNVVGTDISTGPGCMTSGLVRIGDRARLGGDRHLHRAGRGDRRGRPGIFGCCDSQLRAGGHAVKRRVATMTAVPIRGGRESLARTGC